MGMKQPAKEKWKSKAKKKARPAITILPQQMKLSVEIPTVLGHMEYRDFEGQLKQIDEILKHSGVEQELVAADSRRFMEGYEQWGEQKQRVRQSILHHRQKHSAMALRVNILMKIMGLKARGMSVHLALSPLLRKFVGIEMIGEVRVPTKSVVDRYSRWFEQDEIRGAFEKVIFAAGSNGGVLGDGQELDMGVLMVDSTCLEAHVHHPVDWVLLKDATLTLIHAIEQIRELGLVHRMKEPAEFITEINGLCIAMTQAGKRSGDKKSRKNIFRQMKQCVQVVADHGRRYRAMLDRRWEATGLSRKQAEVILKRMDNILEKLPQAIRQAHERIIGERLVENKEKILSLYEPDIAVVKRGKLAAEVEFGNPLFIVEQTDGLLVDFELIKGSQPGDAKWLHGRMEYLQKLQGPDGKVKAVVADRGFDSKQVRTMLQDNEIFNAVYPKSAAPKRDEMEQEVFMGCQKRRAQTEGRIGIFKDHFLDAPASSKGFENRQRDVAMAALVHNLWLLGRMRFKKELQRLEKDNRKPAQALSPARRTA